MQFSALAIITFVSKWKNLAMKKTPNLKTCIQNQENLPKKFISQAKFPQISWIPHSLPLWYVSVSFFGLCCYRFLFSFHKRKSISIFFWKNGRNMWNSTLCHGVLAQVENLEFVVETISQNFLCLLSIMLIFQATNF